MWNYRMQSWYSSSGKKAKLSVNTVWTDILTRHHRFKTYDYIGNHSSDFTVGVKNTIISNGMRKLRLPLF